MNLLLVEDDAMLAEAICDGICQQGWRIDHALDAGAARSRLVEHAYAAVLLDIGLGTGSGLDVLRYLRGRYDTVPVLILTARGQLSDRIRGLDAGADDYLVKPFQLAELFARVRAVIRRSEGQVVPSYIHAPLVLDPVRRQVTLDNEPVALSVHEYQLLLTLLKRRGHIVTRDELELAIYGHPGGVGSNTVSVFVHQLRRKLGDGLIHTVHGHGYTVKDPA
ncbi:response regulator transcription factor [Frateuria aurantia]|uniref:Response regulator with CheY-like receiver domain and winged-helix DNA-binding domain n=1 Tax=Frateuria aurantia (strain ATCC 33424 / DSM 6220 / KCTC 2777 / LMG 1558 / NBRC 3245 / NCIMB 13370) TaxID=767434 RepID=H8L4Y4_FRAAD|nr:response regulator transcription factor [Frateuria aurantia]AFC85698.1 response regulator with CheY-like receiver domain and winged-helix DNA-binding domain [Frateuria aurantia DSM 6220]